jgi:integrase
MVNWAFRHQLIDKNPMEHVTKPRGEVLAPRAPSVQCVQTLLEHLWESDKRMWLAVRLTSTLGLRRSELLAIKWKDLANVFANEVGHLRIDSGIVADRKTKTLITTDTKSGAQSHRTLWLDEQLTADITEMFRGISLERFSDGYVFSDDEDSSKPWYPDTLNKKLSRARSVVANDISSNNPPITFRSLRIFCASVIFANELDVRTAKAVLGHASLQTTDRYYIAFTDEQLREATVGVGKKLSRTPLSGPRY